MDSLGGSSSNEALQDGGGKDHEQSNQPSRFYSMGELQVTVPPQQPIPDFDAILTEIGRDSAYCHVFKDGTIKPIDEAELIEWGTTYHMVETKCPKCTICRQSCNRKHVGHILCFHVCKQSGRAHLWHDLRRRHRRGNRASNWVITLQGYSDGTGIHRECTEEEITTEIKAILQEMREI